ncbi:MAG: hypothetical protein H6Q25_768 [Bacteroidetes bacterium]|nr:hypothetical protein [Bacteroidota bacterium]
MEKQISELIQKLENNKKLVENIIIEEPIKEDNYSLLLHSGKIIAFDYCITELKKILDRKK